MKEISIHTLSTNYNKFKDGFKGMGYVIIYNGNGLSLMSIGNRRSYSLTDCKMQEKTFTAQSLTDEGIISIVLSKDNLSIQLMSLDNKQLLKKVNITMNSNKRETILEGQLEVNGNNIVCGIQKKDGYYFVRITGTIASEDDCTFEQSIEINSETKQFNYLSALTNFTHLLSKSGQVSALLDRRDGNLRYVVTDHMSNRPNNPRTIVNHILTPEESISTISSLVNTPVIKDLSYTACDILSKIFNFDKVALGNFLSLPISFLSPNTLSQYMIDSIDNNLKQVTIPEVTQLIKGENNIHR